VKITVGLPTYGGVSGLTVGSLLELQEAFLARGDVVTFDIVFGGSLIPKTRNKCVRSFLHRGDDYLVFIDTDMAFKAEDILALVGSGNDVAAIPYVSRDGKNKWLVKPVVENDEICAVRQVGRLWMKCSAVGTGLMAIRRRTLTTMAHHSKKYEDGGEMAAVFESEIVDNGYHGEDFLFCKRWIALGGEVWALADAESSHVGEKAYTDGCYLKGL